MYDINILALTSESVDQQQTQSVVSVEDPNLNAQQTKKSTPPMYNFILLGAMFLLMYFVLFRGPKKKQQQHRKMMQNLKKNDRIQTIGGVFGTIVDVKDDEIVLKVDESNNTKIKISPNAIGRNISSDSKE